MLEIIAIIALWKKMGDMMRSRGYARPIGFQLLVILCWFGGEVVGAVAVAIAYGATGHADAGFMPYLGAIATAVVATGLVFLIASRFSRQAPFPPAFTSPYPGQQATPYYSQPPGQAYPPPPPQNPPGPSHPQS